MKGLDAALVLLWSVLGCFGAAHVVSFYVLRMPLPLETVVTVIGASFLVTTVWRIVVNRGHSPLLIVSSCMACFLIETVGSRLGYSPVHGASVTLTVTLSSGFLVAAVAALFPADTLNALWERIRPRSRAAIKRVQ